MILLLLACSLPEAEAPVLETWVGTGTAGLPYDGQCREDAPAYLPTGIAESAEGVVYYADWNNDAVVRILAEGGCDRVRFAAVNRGTVSFAGADAVDIAWRGPFGLAWRDPSVLLVTVPRMGAVLALDIPFATWTWFAGNGVAGEGGDGVPATSVGLGWPSGIAVADDGTVYLADEYNHRVWAVDPDGTLRTAVGSGERGAVRHGAALLDTPLWEGGDPHIGIAVHGQSLYFTDPAANRVWRADLAAGRVEAFAGREGLGQYGEGGPATEALLQSPMSVTVADDGTMYFADSGNHCVRSVDDEGILHTVAGNCGVAGILGEGVAPTDAFLNTPWGVHAAGDTLWIADSYNNLLRRVTPRP